MRYSLRTLFIGFTIVAVILGVTFYVTRDYRERWALENDALTTTGAQFVALTSDRKINLLFRQPKVAAEVKKYRQLMAVELQRHTISGESLENLAGLESLEVLMIQSCKVSDARDLQRLATIGELHSLVIWNTPIDDSAVAAITAIPGLRRVDLQGTRVTPAGVVQLRAARPDIIINLRP